MEGKLLFERGTRVGVGSPELYGPFSNYNPLLGPLLFMVVYYTQGPKQGTEYRELPQKRSGLLRVYLLTRVPLIGVAVFFSSGTLINTTGV